MIDLDDKGEDKARAIVLEGVDYFQPIHILQVPIISKHYINYINY